MRAAIAKVGICQRASSPVWSWVTAVTDSGTTRVVGDEATVAILGEAVVVSDLRFGDVHVGRRTIPEDRPGWIFDFDIVGAGADAVVVDTAHGHSAAVIAAVDAIRKNHPEIYIAGGIMERGKLLESGRIDDIVDRYIAVSRDLEQWLVSAVGVPPRRVSQIYNGVDTAPGGLGIETGRPV